jgi:hypothetical protein
MAISPPFLPSVLIWVTWMSLLALRVTAPPSVFLELELESRARVVISPLAFRAIAPPFVVRFVLTAMLLAA